ncbi:hypothetical protein HgNV_036 [Homarus gammarus nudivirus]|uniref:ATP-dependent DNA ligase family profile domain-containing protein n=1 Tax=Homarus gammarus nudivirus TaxID=2509616 RepID=A0A411HB55_9VIRU|nr:hypothetical protein KM727_gp36 [Homarus gammarus nudivirus]QBB28641.1 hypothetical protein HgNV_036 [Homarus gammarus nudivirus]
MKLVDIYQFLIQTNIKRTPELLLLWLSNYDFYDRILFIKLFILHKIRLSWHTYQGFHMNYQMNHQQNCKCQEVYTNTVGVNNLEFFRKTPVVWFLRNCIGDVELEVATSLKKYRLNTCIELQHYENHPITYESNTILDRYNNIFNVTSLDCTTQQRKPNQQLTIKNLERYSKCIKLTDIISHLYVYDLYLLLSLKQLPTLRELDSILPEYLQLEASRNRLKLAKSLTAEFILINIYNFFNRTSICQVDTDRKMTSLIPITVEIDTPIEDVGNEYFYQAKYSGIRICLCKTPNNDVILMNSNHVKITFTVPCIHELRQDSVNSYAGEFVMVLYNKETNQYMPKTELLKHLSNLVDSTYRAVYKIKLILLDLYMWNGINLLIDAYERRYALFDTFIKYVFHDNIFVKVRNYDNISDIHSEYLQYLKNTQIDHIVKGITYRKKRAVYQKKIPIISLDLKYQKYILISKYNTTIKILNSEKTVDYVDGKLCIIRPPKGAFSLYCLCYSIDKLMLKLALFDNCEFRHFCRIETTHSNSNYNCLMKKKIKINGIGYSWIVIRVEFTKDYENVTNVEFCPEKSILDCNYPWFYLR